MLCSHHVLIWIWSTGQHVRMTIHGAPLSLCLLSISPPRFERARHPSTHTYTHTHSLAHVHTKEDGLKHGQESCPFCQSSSAQTFSQLSRKSSCFLLCSSPLTKTCFILLPAFTYGEASRHRGREVQKAPWPSLPHLPSLGIFHIRAQTSTLS